MAHHHQRDLINNDDATTDRLKLPVHAPPTHTSVVATAASATTGTMPSPLALPPPAVVPAVSPRNPTNQGPFQLQHPDNATPPVALQEATLPPEPAAAAAAAAATASSPIPAPARCSSCRKRLGLAGFRCRCGSLFCAVHRYSDRHTCTFDYKAQAREAIARDNPAYKAPKLLKI